MQEREEREAGGRRWMGGKGGRRSKNGKINREGRILVDFVEERGWSVFNGNIKGDEEGEFTYTGGKGNIVIDYVIGSGEVKEKIAEMRIGDKMDSDHHPLEMTIRREGEERERRGEGEEMERGME